jgi:hypothetical protein
MKPSEDFCSLQVALLVKESLSRAASCEEGNHKAAMMLLISVSGWNALEFHIFKNPHWQIIKKKKKERRNPHPYLKLLLMSFSFSAIPRTINYFAYAYFSFMSQTPIFSGLG